MSEDANMKSQEPAAAPEDVQETLLFVDDEPNILTALRRLFRPMGYRIFTAEGGKQGLEILAREKIDLVISDMRMPEMDGAQFLEQVRLKSPGSVRILLTGYADITSTIDAINKGQIYRYITKPWEDNDISLTVKHALEQQRLAHEKARLEELTHWQNEELKALNNSLEDKVRERTAQLQQAMSELQKTHDKLKRNFLTSIQIFTNFMELRGGHMAGHSRRVAELGRKLAQRLKLPDAEVQDVLFGALLHDIGKIGLHDRLITRPFKLLGKEEREEFMKHSAKGESAMMGLDQIRGAARLVRHHHERYDGLGYPDGLKGERIPLGARILAVVNDYDALQIGTLEEHRMNAEEAMGFIRASRGKRYDPRVVDAFVEMMSHPDPLLNEDAGQGKGAHHGPEVALHSNHLKEGMILARDLITPDGIHLLSTGCPMDANVIGDILRYEEMTGKRVLLHVYEY